MKQQTEYYTGRDFTDDGLIEIGEAKRQLETVVIPHLVQIFDSLTIVPIDSETLTQVKMRAERF